MIEESNNGHRAKLREAAFYEAGRAVVGITLGIRVECIWAVPIRYGEAIVHDSAVAPPSWRFREQYIRFCEDLIHISYAGAIAEYKGTGKLRWRQRIADDMNVANELFGSLSKSQLSKDYESDHELWLYTYDSVESEW